MNGWMDEWMDGWMDGWMDRQVDERQMNNGKMDDLNLNF